MKHGGLPLLGEVEVKLHLTLTNFFFFRLLTNLNVSFSQSHCQVMSKDKRPGVAAVLAALYPEDDKQVEIVYCSGKKAFSNCISH